MKTETQTGLGFKAGVKDYRLTYFLKDYKVEITDILAAFRVINRNQVYHRKRLVQQ